MAKQLCRCTGRGAALGGKNGGGFEAGEASKSLIFLANLRSRPEPTKKMSSKRLCSFSLFSLTHLKGLNVWQFGKFS